jgi:hypothetical protein
MVTEVGMGREGVTARVEAVEREWIRVWKNIIKWGEESDDPMGIYVTALEPLPQITRIMDAGAQE